MNNNKMKPLLAAALFFVCAAMADAQLPNEKFGKPSSMEWDYVGWNDCSDADAIILYKSMKVTYQISDQVSTNYEGSDVSYDNLADFGKNQIDDGSILVNYEFNLRVKILKPEGKRHADVDITYFNADNAKTFNRDELEDLKVRVFTRNEKGKVVKKNVDSRSFVSERVDDNYMVIHVVVLGTDHNQYLYRVAQLSQHPEFRVGLKAGQHARGVVVVKQLAAEFHIQFTVELCDALADVLALYFEVFLVVESYFHFMVFF